MLKFVVIKGLVTPLWPVAYSFSGAALLLAAWPLALHTDFSNDNFFFILTVFLWTLLPLMFVGKVVRPMVPSAITARILLVFTLFSVVMFAFTSNRYREISAQTLSMAGLFLLVTGLAAWEPVHPCLARLGRIIHLQEKISPRLFVTAGFSLFLATAIFLSWYCFSFEPSYMDSTAQYIHGKFVASGHLFYIAAYPLHEFYPVAVMVLDAQKWYSQYPPLHQTLLGLGHLFGAPWLINPLEGALTLVLVYRIARRDYGENIARLACLLMWLSPFMVIMSSEFMNHATSLLFTTLLIYAYGQWLAADDRHKALRWGLAVGVSSGCIFLTRPFTAIGVTFPFALHALTRLRNHRQEYLGPVLCMAASGMACVLLQLWYNFETTGEFLTYAYTRYHSDSFATALGYHDAGGVADSIACALAKMRTEWFSLNIEMFEWSLPCLFFVMLPCIAPAKTLMTRLLIGIMAAMTFIDLFNHFTSSTFGPRYMYESSVPLVILTAVGMARLPSLLERLSGNMKPAGAAQGMAALIVLMVCATGLIYRVPEKIRSYTHHMDSHPEFYRSVLEQTQHPALVFLGRPGKNEPKSLDPLATYRWMSWMNPPDNSAPVIFAHDLGDEKNRALMQYYPTRHAYVESNRKLTPVAGNTP